MVIDLGNTRLKAGLYVDDVLTRTESLEKGEGGEAQLEEWKSQYQPDRIALASTAILTEGELRWISDNNVLQVDANLHYPFTIEYKTPETLGQDRLAAVCGAYALHKGDNVLVIDCGTCITYDFLTTDSRYIGGNIAPGIPMRLRAMHEYTARLPLVDPGNEMKWLGQSTSEALRAGGVSMAIMEARGLIFYLEEKYGSLRTVLTGGDAGFFENHLTGTYEVCANLVLAGLNEILKNNEI